MDSILPPSPPFSSSHSLSSSITTPSSLPLPLAFTINEIREEEEKKDNNNINITMDNMNHSPSISSCVRSFSPSSLFNPTPLPTTTFPLHTIPSNH
jgi:hypothetical protein